MLSCSPYIHTSGRTFIGANNQQFNIRGISLGNWLVPEGYMFHFHAALSPHEINAVFRHILGDEPAARFWTTFRDRYITASDIALIHRAGFNTIRVPLHWALFLNDSDPASFTGPGDALLDRLIAWCRANDLHVILDLHAAPGGQTGVNHDDGTGFPLSFYVPRYRRETIALWAHLAARYAAEPTVLGYDLLNEPISPYHDEATLNPELEPFYRDIATAIRAVDPNHVLILEGAQWSSNFTVFGAPFDTNMAYSYHMFWASPVRASIARMLDFSNRYNVPLLLGETGEYSDAWNEKFRRLHEANGVGWSFWTYKNLATEKSVVSVPLPANWTEVTRFGDTDPATWSPATPRARQAAANYLTAIELQNDTINTGYLHSLGLTAATYIAATTSNTGNTAKP